MNPVSIPVIFVVVVVVNAPLIPCGEFGSPCKATAAARAALPFPTCSVCSISMCPNNTMAAKVGDI